MERDSIIEADEYDDRSDQMTSRSKRRFIRWTAITVLFFAVFSLLVLLGRYFSVKIGNPTGNAVWIWKRKRINSGDPSVFFATRNFVVPPTRTYVKIKVAADAQYTVYFNGREIGGGSSDGQTLDVYDVTSVAASGLNRIVIATRSANGVGGLLVAVDFSPNVENAVVSDTSWRVFTVWSDALLTRNPPEISAEEPMVLGSPPFGRWNYPRLRDKRLYPESRQLIYPSSSRRFSTSLPQIKTSGGIVVTVSEPATATAYDFGLITGRGRVELGGEQPRVVLVRYVSEPGELDLRIKPRELVLARGETSVTDPEERSFRYMVVYNADVEASAVIPGPTASGPG